MDAAALSALGRLGEPAVGGCLRVVRGGELGNLNHLTHFSSTARRPSTRLCETILGTIKPRPNRRDASDSPEGMYGIVDIGRVKAVEQNAQGNHLISSAGTRAQALLPRDVSPPEGFCTGMLAVGFWLPDSSFRILDSQH